LHQVQVVGLLEDAVLEAPAEALQIAVVDVEHVALHDEGDGEGLQADGDGVFLFTLRF